MRKNNYLVGKAAVWLLLTILASACTDNLTSDTDSLPEGKYPLEFTSQMYGMDVTRATSANTWNGGEEIAIKVGSDTRKYTVSDKSAGKISAASGTTPFYWTSSGETKSVSAYYPYALASANVIEVKIAQNDAATYQASDALYAAATSIAYADASKKLTFKHLPAKVVAHLKAGDGVAATEVQGATVKFVNQSLTASFNSSTGVVTAAQPGGSSVVPNAITSPATGFDKSVQALLVPCQMQNKQFIEVAIGSDKFYYTPTTATDGKLESGKVCTYEITVKRDGIEVVLKESGEWGDGGSRDVQSNSLSMKFTIDLTPYPSDKTYILPFSNYASTRRYTLTVDWGDGSQVTTIVPGTDLSSPISHTYVDAKEYTITISTTQPDFSKEQIPGFKPGGYATSNNNPKKLKSLLTPLLNAGATSFAYNFKDCSGLTSIPEDIFANNPQVTSFSDCFNNCSGLTSIPEGLFANNPQVTNFSDCFDNCSGLTSIPEGLFANNLQVTNFSYCFYVCRGLTSIPENLFANNPRVTNFKYCFSNCSGLTSIPEDIFANNAQVTDFQKCFSDCSGLTGSIPEKLFANNAQVENYSSCFQSCSGLSSIPEGLFANNAQVTDFSYCFYRCSGLSSIPEGLFAKNAQVENFSFCFQSCSGLTSIPEGLFANNAQVTDFSFCFDGCSGLTGSIPAGLFAKNPEVTTFKYCFRNCSGLTGSIPAGLFANNSQVTNFSSCFDGCSGLTGSIPEKLFANNAKVTNFSSCFSSAIKLTMNANIFCNETTEKATRFAGKTVDFAGCFYSVGSDTSVSGSAGTAPALWDGYAGTFTSTGCFNGIGTVTNATAIPDTWK